MHPLVNRITRLFTEHVDGLLLGSILLLMGVGLIVLYRIDLRAFDRVELCGDEE